MREGRWVGAGGPLLWLVLLAAGATGCAGGGGLRLASRAPSEQYADLLRSTGLDQAALGRDWLRVSSDALAAPVAVTLPFEESGYFAPDAPRAVAYRLALRRGRRLAVTVQYETSSPGRLFVDLFALRDETSPRRVASLPDGATALTHDVERDGAYVLRVQPELLRGGRYTLTQRTETTLAVFPVAGVTARAVQSGFGAPRDAGARDHEGVDIFAPRGTPVLAVAAGSARVDTNTLGGRVVWLRDGWTGPTYYYAHLDGWAFDGESVVREGDVIGYVGNTGNARTTAPHLHFGIYDGAALDPLPFVLPSDPPPAPAPTAALALLNARVRVATGGPATLRPGTGRDAAVAARLAAGTIAHVDGVAAGGVRVRLPDGRHGYLDVGMLTRADAPLRRLRLAAPVALREHPAATAPVVVTAEAGASVDLLGRFGAYALLRDGAGHVGWSDAAPTP